MTEKSVLVSYLHPNTVSHSFMESLTNLQDYDLKNQNLLYARFPVTSGPLAIPESRNTQVKVFLEETPCEWLWLVDSDMGFQPDALDRLLQSADPEVNPVVGALCYTFKHGGTDGMGGWLQEKIPVAYVWKDGFFWEIEDDLPKDEVIAVDGTGAACLLIHRSVLEALGSNWFTRMQYENGTIVGEDLSFCFRVRHQLNKLICINTGIPISHHKQVWLT